MKRVGTKAPFKNLLGGKRVNQALKIGSKALGVVGDFAPALEAAKLACLGLGLAQMGRQMIKKLK